LYCDWSFARSSGLFAVLDRLVDRVLVGAEIFSEQAPEHALVHALRDHGRPAVLRVVDLDGARGGGVADEQRLRELRIVAALQLPQLAADLLAHFLALLRIGDALQHLVDLIVVDVAEPRAGLGILDRRDGRADGVARHRRLRLLQVLSTEVLVEVRVHVVAGMRLGVRRLDRGDLFGRLVAERVEDRGLVAAGDPPAVHLLEDRVGVGGGLFRIDLFCAVRAPQPCLDRRDARSSRRARSCSPSHDRRARASARAPERGPERAPQQARVRRQASAHHRKYSKPIRTYGFSDPITSRRLGNYPPGLWKPGVVIRECH